MQWLVIRQIMANRDNSKNVGSLVVVKIILYEGTVALDMSMDFDTVGWASGRASGL